MGLFFFLSGGFRLLKGPTQVVYLAHRWYTGYKSLGQAYTFKRDHFGAFKGTLPNYTCPILRNSWCTGSPSTNGIMVWAWMLWSLYGLGTRTELWVGHGFSGKRMHLEHERNYGLGMDALVIDCSWNTNGIMVWAWMLWSPYALGTRTELWFGHGCSGHRMLLWFGHACSGHRMLVERERNYGLGMDALVIDCTWNTNVIMLWAWILW